MFHSPPPFLFFGLGKSIKEEISCTGTMVSVQGHLELVSLSKDIHSTLGSKRKHFFIASGAVSCFHTQGWHKEMCTFQGLLNLGSNYIGHFFPPGCRDSDVGEELGHLQDIGSSMH